MSAHKKLFLKGELSADMSQIILQIPFFVEHVLGAFANKQLIISIEIFRRNRSNRQNRYLHGIVLPKIASWEKHNNGTHASFDTVKAYIYSRILGQQLVEKTVLGETVFVVEGKRMSQMNTVEFNEAVKKIQLHFAEKGLIIPDPREENLLNDFTWEDLVNT